MKFVFLPIALFLLTGCLKFSSPETQTKTIQKTNIPDPIQIVINEHIVDNLNAAIIDIANQLFITNVELKPMKIILTSFVDLDMFDKTSSLGRILSESMFNELHIRKFNVTDFRGQDSISVNEDGEFHISRDTEKLKDTLEAIEYIVVGTYAKFENQSLLINARILDSDSGEVISSARVVYQPKECTPYNLCAIKEEPLAEIDNTGYLYNTDMAEQNAYSESSFKIIQDIKGER